MTTRVNNRMIDGAAINIKDFGAVGDGVTDDTAAIQAALDVALGNPLYERLTVIVPKSESPFIFTQLKVHTRTTFRGEGGTLKLRDNTTVSPTTQYFPINNLGEREVVFDSLIVDGNPDTNQREFTTGVADLITCVGTNSSVINCTLKDAPDSGIMFSNVDKGLCINNIIQGASDAGIYVNGDENSNPQNISVSGNVISEAHTVGIALKRGLNTVTVSENIIFRCGNGITNEDFGTGNGGHPRNMMITSNNITDIGYMWRTAPLPAETGMTLNRLTDSVVSNNRVLNCGGSCIEVSGGVNNIIQGNYLSAYVPSPSPTAATEGIVLRRRVDPITSNITNCINNIVSDNIVLNVQSKAIFLNDADAVGTVIKGNIAKSLNNTGMRVDAGTSQTQILDNNFQGLIGDFDLQVLPGTSIIVRGNVLANDAGGDYQERAGTPVGFLTPRYVGERAFDTSNIVWYTSTGLANTDWV